MSRTDEIDKIVDEIGDADSLYEFAEGIYEDRQRIAELEEQLKNAAKQVRKKVCEEIRSRFLATCQIEKGCDTASFSLEVLNRILDQLQESQGGNK